MRLHEDAHLELRGLNEASKQLEVLSLVKKLDVSFCG